MVIPDGLTWLLKNLYAGQEAAVRHGTMDWFKIGKGVKAVYCHPAYLTYMQSEVKVKVAQSCLTLWDPMHYTVHGVLQARILEYSWVGCYFLLQGIFPTQGSNPGVAHCRRILYQLSYRGSPIILEWVAYPIFRRSSQPGIKRDLLQQEDPLPTELSGKPWYAECIMWNAGLDKAQAGIKITRRNINNLCMQMILL